LPKTRQFDAWLHGDAKTIFCPGIQGSGKTVMASFVVKYLQDEFPSWSFSDHRTGIAFLYCDYGLRNSQSHLDLLSSLLTQLVRQLPTVPDVVRGLYEKYGKLKTGLAFDKLEEALVSTTQLYRTVFVVIDALDECQEVALDRLMSTIRTIQRLSEMKLMTTSREIDRASRYFEGDIKLPIEAHREDIELYIDSNIICLPIFVLTNPVLKKEVKTTIIKAVGGMFLLARLHMESLRHQISEKGVRSALANLPRGEGCLKDAYGSVVQRIQEQLPQRRQLAERVLSWIVGGKRLFGLEELRHALAVEPNETELDSTNLPDVGVMSSACLGLATIDQKSDTIRLSHFTVQEYFVDSEEHWMKATQADIASACITYLSFSTFDAGFCSTDEEFELRQRNHPFYEYASQYWADHTRAAALRVAEPLILAFLQNDAKVAASSQAMMVSANEFKLSPRKAIHCADCSQMVPGQITGIHLAAYFGLWQSIVSLLRNKQDVNVKDTWDRVPISWAAEKGHHVVVEILLKNGAEQHSKDKCGWTPLSWAAEKGHSEIVKLLLENGADQDAEDAYGLTPLSWAVDRGHRDIVKLLLQMGARTHRCYELMDTRPELRQDELRQDELRQDEFRRDEFFLDFVEYKLLEKGRWRRLAVYLDNPRSRKATTPLSRASEKGDEEVVKLLLDHDANPNSKDGHGRTPLWWATQMGHKQVVKALLEKQAEPSSNDNDSGIAPLLVAALRGHETVIQLLLCYGADVRDTDIHRETALAIAVGGECEIMDRLLLEHFKQKGHTVQDRDTLRSLIRCANCLSRILYWDFRYHCSLCDSGNFNLCQHCIKRSIDCYDKRHHLTLYAIEYDRLGHIRREKRIRIRREIRSRKCTVQR
jgi:ankyrin repeat protein